MKIWQGRCPPVAVAARYGGQAECRQFTVSAEPVCFHPHMRNHFRIHCSLGAPHQVVFSDVENVTLLQRGSHLAANVVSCSSLPQLRSLSGLLQYTDRTWLSTQLVVASRDNRCSRNPFVHHELCSGF